MTDLDANRNRHHAGVLALDRDFFSANAVAERELDPAHATILPDPQFERFSPSAPTLDPAEPANFRNARPLDSASGRYKILRPHANGGLGCVSIALEEELNREVALKELRNQHADDPALRSRFVLEAEVTGNLEHPGIVPVYGLGKFPDGRPYYAMRFIRGGSFTEAIKRFHDANAGDRSSADDPLAFRKLLRRFIDVCNAVEYAHSRGVLHRDLKPDNVMLGEYGETLVVDWGLAKVTGQREPVAGVGGPPSSGVLPLSNSGSSETLAGFAIGTPQFMSPEQAAGQLDRLGPTSDVYSLGAMLYCLLTGGSPFQNMNVQETLRCVRQGDFPRPRQKSKDISKSLEAVCLKAMAAAPEQRYPSARALANDLEHWLADEPVAAYREPRIARLARFARRHRAWTQATATALLAVTIVSAFAVYITHQERRVAERLASENESLATTETCLRKTAEKQAAFLAFGRSYLDCLRNDAAQGMNALALCLREASRVEAPDTETLIRLQLAGWARDIHPLHRILRNDKGRVTCVAFSPDARQVVTGDGDGTVQRWDVETGDPSGEPIYHEQSVSAVAIDKSGKVLLTASLDKTVRLYDADSGFALGSPFVHPEPVTCAAISPDGRTVVTGSTDSMGRLWDVRMGELIGALLVHDGRVSSVAFSPDGAKIVTGSHDKTARIWEAATGLPLGPAIVHGEQVHAVAFDPDGKLIVTGMGDTAARSGVAQYWDCESGRAVGAPLVHQDTVESLAVSPDGKTLLTGSNDCKARLWDIADGRTIGSPLMHNCTVTGVAFSRDCRRVVTGSGAGPARVWELNPSREGFLPLNQAGAVRSTVFSPDGQHMLTASEDGKTRLWDVAGSTIDSAVAPARICEWPGTVAAISADGGTIVTGSSDHTAHRWDRATGRQIGSALIHSAPISAVELSSDGEHLLTRTDDNIAHLWHIGRRAGTEALFLRRWACRAATFSPHGKTILTGGDDGRAWVQETASGNPIGVPFVQQKAVLAVAFHPNGKFILTGSTDGAARLWNLPTGKLAGRPMYHRHRVAALAFSPDGKMILTGSEDNTARLWETSTLMQIGPPLKHQTSVRTVAFSPDGRTIVTGSVDGMAQFWEVPIPLVGDVERIILWTQVTTGLALEDDGDLTILNARAWALCKQKLAQ